MKVTHVAVHSQEPDVSALATVAAQGFVGFAASCGKLPLREGAYDVLVLFGLDTLVFTICPGPGSLGMVLSEVCDVVNNSLFDNGIA